MTSSDGSYAANQEKAVSIPPTAQALPVGDEHTLETPGQITIEQLCAARIPAPRRSSKCWCWWRDWTTDANNRCVSLRGDQELNEVKLTNTLSRHLESAVLDVAPVTADQVRKQGLAPLALDPLA